MIGIQEWLRDHGVDILVVSFAEPQRLRRYQAEFRWSLRIVADPDRTLYRELGLGRLSWHRLLSWRTLRTYWRLWRHGHRIRGTEGDDIHQSGGDFLIDATGRITYAYRSHDPADRPTLDQLQQAVRGQ